MENESEGWGEWRMRARDGGVETGGGDGSETGQVTEEGKKLTNGASLALHFRDLTRFNKICHPSQRPRWQVDKEAIGLSRVQQCSPTYNPPS